MKNTSISFLSAVLGRHSSVLILTSLTLVAYFSAISRLQPLLWAIAALMSATLLIGIFLPRWLVRQLSVERQGPQRATEGESISLSIEVENHGWLPRFMIELIDHLPFADVTRRGVTPGESKLGLLAYVPGGGKRSFALSLVCEKRGFYYLGPAGLASSFPLGLIEARQKRDNTRQTLTVYPSVFPIVQMPLQGSPSQLHRGSYLLAANAGTAEFSGLREYRRGDNPRHVHWPTTARLNELMIKEFEPLASACLYLVLDQAIAANVGQGREASFEYAVRIAASIAKFACANNIPTRLLGQGQSLLQQPPGTGEQHYQHLLDELAVVAADGSTAYASVLQRVTLDCQRGETVVVFLSEVAEQQTQTLQHLAVLRDMGVNIMAMIFQRSSFVKSTKQQEDSVATAQASLLELGAGCMRIDKGTDLTRLFNS